MTVTVGDRTADTWVGVRPGRNVLGAVIAGLLVVDGLVTILLEALFLPIYAGQAHVHETAQVQAMAAPWASTPMTEGAIALPFTALVAAVVNVLLVAGMSVVSDRISVLALPLFAWILGFFVCAGAVPGLGGLLVGDWPTLALMFGGLIPPGLYLYWRATAGPAAGSRVGRV